MFQNNLKVAFYVTPPFASMPLFLKSKYYQTDFCIKHPRKNSMSNLFLIFTGNKPVKILNVDSEKTAHSLNSILRHLVQRLVPKLFA
jgi:hypothetical protein